MSALGDQWVAKPRKWGVLGNEVGASAGSMRSGPMPGQALPP